MLHFTCDLCGRRLGERRFVVKMEVYPAFDPEAFDEDDLDVDHLQEVAEVIEQIEATGQCHVDDCGSKQMRFDLCENCRRKFVRDPLGRENARRLNFSEN